MDTTDADVQASDTACDLFLRCVTTRQDDAWYEFMRRYGRWVRNQIRDTLFRHGVRRADQELEEYVQDFYLRLLAASGRGFQGRTDFELRRYLASAVRNLIVDRWRQSERRREHVVVPTPRWLTLQAAPSPEHRAMARQDLREFLASFERAVRGFRTELKLRVMRLAYVDGWSSHEIAREVSGELAAGPMTPNQVDTMIHRLRRSLAREGIEIHRRCRAAS